MCRWPRLASGRRSASMSSSTASAPSPESPSAVSSARMASSSIWPVSQWVIRSMFLSSGLMDIGGQEHVLADRSRIQPEERDACRKVAEEVWAVAAHDGSDEDQKLVDQAGLEERRGERWAALEQERLDAFLTEPCQLLAERTAEQLYLRIAGEWPFPEGEPTRLAGRFHAASVEPRSVRPHRSHADRHGVGR